MSRSSLKVKGAGVAGLLKNLQQPPVAKVGIFAADQDRTEGLVGNVAIGTVHEFGSPSQHIPERSFLRRTADRQSEAWKRLMAMAGRKAAEGKITLTAAMELVALKAAADVRATITRGAGVPPPNSPRTIARKGSSRPLVDTGQLVNSITYVIGSAQPAKMPAASASRRKKK